MIDINAFDEWTKKRFDWLGDDAQLEIPPIDKNRYEQLKNEGYAHEVILGNYEREFREKVKDFARKEFILKHFSNDRELAYYEFMELVYGDADELIVVTADTSYATMDRDELIDYMQCRNDVYVPPCTFIHGCYKAETCKNVYALVIDIDNVKSSVISNILTNGNMGNRIPMPTIITNSGNGLHFYYVLEQRVPYFKKQRMQLQEIYRKLFHTVKDNIISKADWHSIIQPFRLPGSITKLGLVATAYQFNDKWKIEDLARFLGFEQKEWDFSEIKIVSRQEHRENIKKLKEQQAKTSEKNNKRRKKIKLREGLKGFYDYSLQRTYQKTKQGSRYRSLVALTMIGYKARIPKEELRKDFEKLLVHFNSFGDTFLPKEIDKALRTYNSRAEKVRSTTLEELFDWEFERWREKAAAKSKKKKRNQTEHLKFARTMKKVKKEMGEIQPEGRPNKQKLVAEWRISHPKGRKFECQRETGLSKPTVLKWWDYEGNENE